MNKNDKKAHRPSKGLVDPRMIKEFKVYRETTLLEFLFLKFPSTPKKNVKSLLAHHQVAVGGVPISQFDYPLCPEDVVTVSQKSIAKREGKGLKVIFEDDDIIAIDKPSGLLSVATEREKGHTAYRLVSEYLDPRGKGARAYVVHRLDEDTSGVLIFAKNLQTRETLQSSWQEIVVKRGYYAIVEGHLPDKEGTLSDYLYQDSFQLVRVSKEKGKGKLAITHYRTIAEKDGYSLLDVNIDSGRKNQIRVQLGHIGHHVIGDDKYGEPSDPLKRLGLHAYELAFSNPLNGKSYDIVSPLPEEFKSLLFGKKKAERKKEAPTRDTRSMTKIKAGKRRQSGYGKRMGGRK